MELRPKLDLTVVWIELIAVDFIIYTKEQEEKLIQSKFSYKDVINEW